MVYVNGEENSGFRKNAVEIFTLNHSSQEKLDNSVFDGRFSKIAVGLQIFHFPVTFV